MSPHAFALFTTCGIWIAFRHTPVFIDSQKLAMVGVQVLCMCRVGIFTDGHIQLAIFSKMHGPTVVIRSAAQWIEFQDNRLASCQDNITISGEPADAIMNRRGRHRVVQIEIVIGGKIRIQSDPDKASFAGKAYRQLHECSGEQYIVFYYPKFAALLSNEYAAIRRESHCRRVNNAIRYQHSGKICGKNLCVNGSTAKYC